MKLIAHRGWSAGEDENTVAAFARTAWDDRISGVEFGVRYVADTGNLVVSHDPPLHIENALTLDPALSFLSQTALELFVEFKETGLASVVIEKLLSSLVTWPTARSCSYLPPSHDPFCGRLRDRCAWASLSHIHGI